MPALDRRTLIKNMLPGAVVTVAGATACSYLLKPTVAEALSIPQKKIDAETGMDFLQKRRKSLWSAARAGVAFAGGIEAAVFVDGALGNFF